MIFSIKDLLMKQLYLLLLFPFFISCSTTVLLVKPHYQLINDSSSQVNAYEDSLITILFSPAAEVYDFTLLNRTDEPMYINWEETSFIKGDVAGPVISKEVDYYDKLLPMKPTLIPPKMKRVDKIIPIDNIVINDFGARLEVPLSKASFKTREQVDSYLKSTENHIVYLTLETSTGPVAYQFTFDNVGEITSYEESTLNSDFGTGLSMMAVIVAVFATLRVTIW